MLVDRRHRSVTARERMGPILGAEFLMVVGKISAFERADRHASHAGPVPEARDSGEKRIGNGKRM